MQHCDPDVLALLALGEPAPDADAAHLGTCAQCRDEVEALARIVSTVRSDPEADAVLAAQAGAAVAPPPRVWDAIAAQTGVAVAPRPERVAAPAAVLPLPARARVRRSRGGSRDGGAGAARPAADARAGGRRRAGRRSRRRVCRDARAEPAVSPERSR